MSSFLSILLMGFQIYIVSALIYVMAFIVFFFVLTYKLGRLGMEQHMTIQKMLDSREDAPTKSIGWYIAFAFIPVVRIIMLLTLAVFAFNTTYFIEWMDKRKQELEDREL